MRQTRDAQDAEVEAEATQIVAAQIYVLPSHFETFRRMLQQHGNHTLQLKQLLLHPKMEEGPSRDNNPDGRNRKEKAVRETKKRRERMFVCTIFHIKTTHSISYL